MINSKDYNIYKAIQQEKKLTDIYIGFQEFEWFFSKATYTATCTEAIDFTLFDKTICGLLKIEDHLSLEQIGEILGFNVIDNPSEKKYKDIAEYEILKEALQSLEDFEMIEGGDIYFSYCTLTPTGREYVEKGKKFKVHEDKKFTLYFDNTNNDHAEAKVNFEFLEANRIAGNQKMIDYEDESFLKSFAEHQIPEIYNPEKMNSFKDAVLQRITYYKTTLNAVFLLDVNTGKHKTLVFEETNNKISEYFTEYINNNIDADNQYFNSFLASKYYLAENLTLDNNYIQQLNNFQEKIEIAIQENENVSEQLNHYYLNANFIEKELFVLNLDRIIENSESEIWLSLNTLNSDILMQLELIFKKIASQDKFLFVNIIDDAVYETEIEKLIDLAEQSMNIYLLAKDNISEFNCSIKINNSYKEYSISNLPYKVNLERNNFFIEKPIIRKTNLIDDKKIEQQLIDFAESHFDFLYEKIGKMLVEFDYEKQNDKQALSELEISTQKLNPFSKIQNCRNRIKDIEKLRDAQIVKVQEKRKLNILELTSKIIQDLDKNEYNIKTIEDIKYNIAKEKEKCFDFELELFTQLDKKVNFIEKEIELMSKRKSIVIDTNILIEEPDIFKIIGTNEIIIFSGKVIDELDYLKTKPELKEKAQNAIRNIKRHQSDKNVKFNLGKIDLLPDDFDKKSPDNKILSVLIKYRNRNPVLLTNDNGMHLKAKTLDIPAKTVDELKILLNPEKDNKKKKQVNKKPKRQTKKRK